MRNKRNYVTLTKCFVASLVVGAISADREFERFPGLNVPQFSPVVEAVSKAF